MLCILHIETEEEVFFLVGYVTAWRRFVIVNSLPRGSSPP